MDIPYGKGDQIILTDRCSQTFLGVIKSINVDLGRIVLKDIVQLPGHKSIIGYRNFDKNEIVEIKKYEAVKEDSEKQVKDVAEPQETDMPVPQLSELSIPKLSDSECEKIKKNQNEYRYIRDFGVNFYAAISLLKTCSRVGIYGKDTSKGRLRRLSLMAISAPSNLFVFDLQALGDDVLERGLKEILESPDIIKVVYDCRLLSDCLIHKHLISLENVRDVEAEDIMVLFQDRRFIRRHARSLEYLCNVYLGVDLETCTETGEAWNQRPLPKNLLEVLVSHASILIPLQDEIERKYLQKLIGASNIYKNYLRNFDFFDFLENEPKKTLRKEIHKLLAPESKTRVELMQKKVS